MNTADLATFGKAVFGGQWYANYDSTCVIQCVFKDNVTARFIDIDGVIRYTEQKYSIRKTDVWIVKDALSMHDRMNIATDYPQLAEFILS